MSASGYRIMAIIRGFQPFDESSILSTRSIHKKSGLVTRFNFLKNYLIALPEKENL